jgi:nitrate reductase delta subunit
LLGQTLHIVSALRERLKTRGSIYAGAFLALEVIAGGKADRDAVAEILKVPEDDPDDLEALDAIWEEEAVTFAAGAGTGDCGPDRLRRQLRAADRPAPRPDTSGGF